MQVVANGDPVDVPDDATVADLLAVLGVSGRWVLVERNGNFYVEDQGSLNGTFVNRRRIDTVELENGDELQIGKYRLTFIER